MTVKGQAMWLQRDKNELVILKNTPIYVFETEMGNYEEHWETTVAVTRTDDEGYYEVQVPCGKWCVFRIYHDEYVFWGGEICTTNFDEENPVIEQNIVVYWGVEDNAIMNPLCGYLENKEKEEVIANVKVEIRRGWEGVGENTEDLEFVGQAITDDQGYFSMDLPAGYYTLIYKKDGYISRKFHLGNVPGFYMGTELYQKYEENQIEMVVEYRGESDSLMSARITGPNVSLSSYSSDQSEGDKVVARVIREVVMGVERDVFTFFAVPGENYCIELYGPSGEEEWGTVMADIYHQGERQWELGCAGWGWVYRKFEDIVLISIEEE